MTERDAAAWRPSIEHELLVRATMDTDDDRARAAWMQWSERVDMTHLDMATQRFLPLLYRRLGKLSVDHPLMKLLGLEYRRNWAKNQLAIHQLEELLAAFAHHNIDTLVLKGAALLLRYYHDIGVRVMADFDVLVPVAQTQAAFDVLVEAGWQSEKGLHLLPAEHRAPFHGMGYAHADKTMGCDLHWHVIHMNLAERYDVPLWAEAVPLQVGAVQSRALCAEHQLIHILFNGCMNEGSVHLRWLPDALVVLQHEPAFRWDRLVAQCQLLEFVRPATSMLTYLRSEWEIPVPDEVMDELQRTPVRYSMRKVYESLNTEKRFRSSMQTFWILYTQYELSQPARKAFSLLEFIRFLRHRWSLAGSVGQTLKYAWQRMRGKTAKEAREAA